MSANLNIITKQSRQDYKKIKELSTNKENLESQVSELTEKVESKEKEIKDLKSKNLDLKVQLQNLKDFFDKLIKLFKRMIKRDDKEESYLEVLEDMHDNRIINDKTFDNILDYNEPAKEKKSKEKDDFGL